jgi:hypothetical protein
MLLTAITAHLLLSIDFSKSGYRRYKAANSEAPRPSRQEGTGTAGLPGKVISFYIVPLDPALCAGLAGHVPVRMRVQSQTFSDGECE